MLSRRNLLALTGLGALLATVVLFAGVMGRPGTPPGISVAGAAPETTTVTATVTATAPSSSAATSTTTTTVTSTSPATSAAPTSTEPSGDYATDSRGYINSSARCDEGQKAVAIGRTQRSKVVICSTSDGGYRYFGVRVSDGAALQADAEATDTGYQATAEGSTYTVEPSELTVVSEGKVIYRDTWIDFYEPQSSSETTSTTSTTAPTSTTVPTSTSTATPTSTLPAAPRSWG
ncbi:MAG: hypothetical protein HYZ38_23915 [Mycobacterium sp.]|nr:hypothetical protein [Mycobacterium sp.]